MANHRGKRRHRGSKGHDLLGHFVLDVPLSCYGLTKRAAEPALERAINRKSMDNGGNTVIYDPNKRLNATVHKKGRSPGPASSPRPATPSPTWTPGRALRPERFVSIPSALIGSKGTIIGRAGASPEYLQQASRVASRRVQGGEMVLRAGTTKAFEEAEQLAHLLLHHIRGGLIPTAFRQRGD